VLLKHVTARAIFYIFVSLIMPLLVVGCVTVEETQETQVVQRIPYRVISGSIFYPNNLYFPARIRLEITLTAEHVSTGRIVPLVSQTIRNPQRFPVNFILRYDPRDISRVYEYSIVVELYRENEETPYLRNLPFPLPELTGDDNIILELQEVRIPTSFRQ